MTILHYVSIIALIYSSVIIYVGVFKFHAFKYRFEGIRYGVAKDIAQVVAAMCAFAQQSTVASVHSEGRLQCLLSGGAVLIPFLFVFFASVAHPELHEFCFFLFVYFRIRDFACAVRPFIPDGSAWRGARRSGLGVQDNAFGDGVAKWKVGEDVSRGQECSR